MVIPASAFLDELGLRHRNTDAAGLKADWIFNNTAVTMTTETNLITRVQVPEAGVYYLYARSQGDANNTFAVAVGDAVTGPEFGGGPLGWKKASRTFTLPAGRADVKITRIRPPARWYQSAMPMLPNSWG